VDAMRPADSLAALAARGISPSAQLAFLQLSFAVGGGTQNPSLAWLSGRTGCGEQTVRRALQELVEAGLLIREKQGRGNRYKFGSYSDHQNSYKSDLSCQIGSHFGNQNGRSDQEKEKSVCTHTSSSPAPSPTPAIPREIAAEYIRLKAADNGALSAYLWRAWRDDGLQIGDLQKLREAAAAKAAEQAQAAAEESPYARESRLEAERQARLAKRREEEAETERQFRAKWAELTPPQRAAAAQEFAWDAFNPPLHLAHNIFKLTRFIEQNSSAVAQVGSCDL